MLEKGEWRLNPPTVTNFRWVLYLCPRDGRWFNPILLPFLKPQFKPCPASSQAEPRCIRPLPSLVFSNLKLYTLLSACHMLPSFGSHVDICLSFQVGLKNLHPWFSIVSFTSITSQTPSLWIASHLVIIFPLVLLTCLF